MEVRRSQPTYQYRISCYKPLGTAGQPTLIQITHKRMMSGEAFLETLVDDPTLMHEVRQQVGREIAEKDQLRIVEFKPIYQWAIDRARSKSSG